MRQFMNTKNVYRCLLTFVLCLASLVSRAGDFVDFSKANRFIEVDVHALAGVSSIFQNYQTKFPQIQNLNINNGGSFGVGGKAVLGIRNYLGFGTAIDVLVNNYNYDMAILGSDNMSMSSVFIDNRNFFVNIPVFLSFRFNVDNNVRWNVDLGMYYAYGFAGTQKQRIYRAQINAMDELVPELVNLKTDYFHSSSTFISPFNRGELGLHLATSLNFGKHLIVGARMQIDFKNSARHSGIETPYVRPFYFHGTIGYRF